MKKLLLLAIALLTVVGVQAQYTSLSTRGYINKPCMVGKPGTCGLGNRYTCVAHPGMNMTRWGRPGSCQPWLY